MGWNFLSTQKLCGSGEDFRSRRKSFAGHIYHSGSAGARRFLCRKAISARWGSARCNAGISGPERDDFVDALQLRDVTQGILRGFSRFWNAAQASLLAAKPVRPFRNRFSQANVYAAMKNEKNAKANYEEARPSSGSRKCAKIPADAPRHALLGLIYAGLGRCEEAIAEGKRATELLPETKDAFDGPILTVSLARIYVRCGNVDNALGILERSLDTPAGVTVPELKFDPTWDPLRNHPRFQQMLTKHGSAQTK